MYGLAESSVGRGFLRPYPIRPDGHRRRGCDHAGAPIDVVAQFGEDPDVDEVDAHVRRVMQKGLEERAAKRRFPILG